MEGGPPPMVGDFVKLYNTVVDFKHNLAKIFLDKGLVTESTKLDAIKTVAMETHTDVTAQVHQLSSDVLLVFKLIAELIHTTLVNKAKASTAVSTSDKASQTDHITDNLVVQSATSSLIKEEKDDHFDKDEDDNDSFHLPNSTGEDIPPKSTLPPLRKSSRTSVLNRKPFVKPKKQKPAALKSKKQKPAAKLVGAQKRKQGGVMKILSANSDKKKTLAMIVSTEAEGKRPRRGDRPLSTRRAAVFATNLYERTAEGLFRCKECGKEAKLQTNIRKHLRKHTGEKPFQCTQCPKKFTYPQDLNRHRKTHTGINPHKEVKPTPVKTLPDFPTTRRAGHGAAPAGPSAARSDSGDTDCNESLREGTGKDVSPGFKPNSLMGNASTPDESGEEEEEEAVKEEVQVDDEGVGWMSVPDPLPTGSMYEATGTGLYRCTVCGRETKDRSNIRKHFLKWHAGEKRYRCGKCSKAFAYPESLRHHQKVHVDPSTRAFERTTKGTFRCKQCGHESKNRSNIVKHVKRRHLNVGEKPYKCSQCPAVFAYPRSLKRHELVHEGVRPYKCPQCDKCFFDPTSLRTHSRVHTDDRPYVCQICGNRFRQNEGLKGHMRRHTGDRPYVCERCGMAFAAKRSLTRHIRVHTGERPYPCDQCVAAFADWTTLHNHKLVHRDPVAADGGGGASAGGGGQGAEGQGQGMPAGSESKPYQCQFCGIRYRQPLSLKRHLRLHSSAPAAAGGDGNGDGDSLLRKASPKKKPRKRRPQDGGDGGLVGDGEEGSTSSALHLQYRPYQCELCGERFKHLRGYETHKGKHESGTLTAKRAGGSRPRVKRAGGMEGVGGEEEGGGERELQHLSHQDIEQAATILASVAVNSTSTVPATPGQVSVIHEPLPAPPPPPAPPNHHHHHNHHHQSSGIVGGTVTVLDPATMNSLSIAVPPSSSSSSAISSASHTLMPSVVVSNNAPTAVSGTGADVIQYTSESVTQMIRYPDGTLGQVTALVPHHHHHQHHQHPPTAATSTLMQPLGLLDNVVTVVFETNSGNGNVVVENQ